MDSSELAPRIRTGSRVNPRTLLTVLLVILLLLIAFFIYLYYLLSRPPIQVFSSQEFTPLFSIYAGLNRPHDVAFDRQGNIYVSDAANARVAVFDSRGRFLRQLGKRGLGRGELSTPLGLSVAPDGRLFVADQMLGKVVVFSPTGRLIREIPVMMPLKPLVARNRLYVASYGPVRVFTLKGRLLSKWGQRGRAPGEFQTPIGLAVDKKGVTYVSDTNNLRLQALSSRGDVLWVEGKPAADIMATDRRFGLPAGLAIDEKGILYLVDAFDHQVEVLTGQGKTIANLSGEGDQEGQLYYPAGIAYWRNGIFAIADKFNDRVQVVRITLKNETVRRAGP